MDAWVRRSSQNQLTHERPALALELRHQLGGQLAALQHQHDGRVGLAQRAGQPVVESDPAEPAQQTARADQVEAR